MYEKVPGGSQSFTRQFFAYKRPPAAAMGNVSGENSNLAATRQRPRTATSVRVWRMGGLGVEGVSGWWVGRLDCQGGVRGRRSPIELCLRNSPARLHTAKLVQSRRRKTSNYFFGDAQMNRKLGPWPGRESCLRSTRGPFRTPLQNYS